MHMCHCMHAIENILKSEGNLLESPFLPPVGSRDKTQNMKLVFKNLHPLSCLTGQNKLEIVSREPKKRKTTTQQLKHSWLT